MKRVIFGKASLTVFAVLLFASQISFVTHAKAGVLVTDFPYSELPSVLTELTNSARTENGLAPVTHNAVLDAAAEAAARDMASKGYFAHEAPDGTTPWYWLDQAGYIYRTAGQNLAVNFSDAQSMQTGWLNSPTHRENILKPAFTEVGFGTANGFYQGEETTFVVEFFGTPRVPVQSTLKPVNTVATVEKALPAAPVAPSVPTVLAAEVREAPQASTTTPPAVPQTIVDSPVAAVESEVIFVAPASEPPAYVNSGLMHLVSAALMTGMIGMALLMRRKLKVLEI